ncbi:hypothetical protein Nepgr_006691 [Nepenthes gracilis]|uniref:Uncharacterized protein n=1 Tax=Nepenthes gracilis TaxID=150966 RepID=A0AAD3S607_NEPGR|nr:hypothetical protein Nepgr_006691 [Nepenthes gracilis]
MTPASASDAGMMQTPGLYRKAADVGLLAVSFSPSGRSAATVVLLELKWQSLAGAVGMLFWLLWCGSVGFQLLDGCSPLDDEASAG